MDHRKLLIAAAAALAVVGVWYAWRDYNTQRINNMLAFDMEAYLSQVTDATNWDDYVPLSLEVPQ